MISIILILNLKLFNPIGQRFEEINNYEIKKYKVKTGESELELLPFIQFERPEAISASM